MRGREETGTQFPWQPQIMLDHNLHGRWKRYPCNQSSGITEKGNDHSSNKTASNEILVIFLQQIEVAEACELTKNLKANYGNSAHFPSNSKVFCQSFTLNKTHLIWAGPMFPVPSFILGPMGADLLGLWCIFMQK